MTRYFSFFYKDIQRIREQRELNQYFATLDELMEGDASQQKKALEMLKRREELVRLWLISSKPQIVINLSISMIFYSIKLRENSEFLWRFCKSLYLSAVALGQDGDTDGRKKLVLENMIYGLI